MTTNTMESLWGCLDQSGHADYPGRAYYADCRHHASVLRLQNRSCGTCGPSALFLVNSRMQKKSERISPKKIAADSTLVEQLLDTFRV